MLLSNEINRIINNVPKNLTEIEIARYVYLELGKIIRHDTFFKFSENFASKNTIFNEKINSPESVSKDVICNSSAELYVYILKRLNINAFCHYYDCIQHADAIIKSSDGLLYVANLIGDLSRIQTGRTTKNFAKENYYSFLFKELLSVYGSNFRSLSVDQLHEIDNKLGYTLNGLYLDSFFKQLKEELANYDYVENYILPKSFNSTDEQDKANKLLSYKFHFMLKNLQTLNEQNDKLGYCEAMTYYHILLTSIFSPKELPKIKRYNCYKKDNFNNEDIVSVIALNLDTTIEYYMYSSKTNKYIPVSQKLIEKLFSSGFHSDDFYFDKNHSVLGFDERAF